MTSTATETETPVAEIRKWAVETGLSVGERGRLPQAVVKAYHAAKTS